ncbi:hypothetical protein AB4254_08670 [Vibrio breoganii]
MNIVHASHFLVPESVAFLSYVLKDDYGIAYNDLMFEEVDADFLKVKVLYVTKLYSGSSETAEIGIVGKTGEPKAFYIRQFKDGIVIERSVSFMQFVMAPYAVDIVRQALIDLPPIPMSSPRLDS